MEFVKHIIQFLYSSKEKYASCLSPEEQEECYPMKLSAKFQSLEEEQDKMEYAEKYT